MFYYRAYQHSILINIPLGLPHAPEQPPDYTVSVQRQPLADQHIRWVHDYEPDSDYPWHRLGTLGADYLVRFSDCADFIIKEERGVIHCLAPPSTRYNTIEHLLLDQVLPRLLDRKMFTALHAGAIVHGNRVIGLVGKTGAGKSTLTAYLGKQGSPVLSDDCLVLQHTQDRLWGLPSYPALRLNSETAELFTYHNDTLPLVADYSAKLRIEPHHGNYAAQTESAPLQALFILNESDQPETENSVSLEDCSMRQAFSVLLEHTFRLDPTDRQSTIREFDNLNLLVSKIPFYSLKYTRNYDLLEEVMRVLFEKIADTA